MSDIKVEVGLETWTKGPISITNTRHDGTVVSNDGVVILGYDQQGQPFELDFYIKDLLAALNILKQRPEKTYDDYASKAWPSLGISQYSEPVSASAYRGDPLGQRGTNLGGSQSAEIAPASS